MPFVAHIAMNAMVSSRIIAWFAKRGIGLIFSKRHLASDEAKCNTDYDATFSIIAMNCAQSGFFEPLLEAILPHLSGKEEKFIVDIGWGRQSFIVAL